MKVTLEELSAIAAANLDRLAEEKKAGTPLIVYNSTFVPAELIRAAGANTYMLCRGGEEAPADAALDYILRCINPQARANYGYLVTGMDKTAPLADLVVMAYSDSHMGRMSELLEFKGVPVYKIGVPADWTEELSYEYYLRSLRTMLGRVEAVTGRSVDPERARSEFARSNRVKACMRRLNALRLRDGIPLTFETVLRLHNISPLLCRDADADALESFAASLETAPPVFPEDAPRLLVIMRTAAAGDYDILRMLDEAGCAVAAEVVDECVCVSDSEVSLEGDPVESFARSRYRGTLPVSSFQPSWKLRFERVRSLIREYRVGGIVWYQLECDEIYDMEYGCISRWAAEMGIPVLKLETDFDYTEEKLARKKAQIARFAEVLRAR